MKPISIVNDSEALDALRILKARGYTRHQVAQAFDALEPDQKPEPDGDHGDSGDDGDSDVRPGKKSKKDDRIVKSFLAVISNPNAAGREPSLLDTLALASPWNRSWPDMYATLPRFLDHMNFGSVNIKSLASGCGLWHRETRDAARQSWLNAAMLQRTIGFEMEEPGTRLLYASWTLEGHLLGYRYALAAGDTELINYFSSWLALWWKSRQLSMLVLPDGPMSLRCGARSQGVYNRTIADYADSIAFSIPWKWRAKPHSLPDQYLRTSDEAIAFDNLKQEIKASWSSAERFEFESGKWPIIAPMNYYRTSQGLAVWCEKADVNGNTPGISAMISYDGADNLTCCPNPPDRHAPNSHKRQMMVPQSISYDAGNRVLSFTQSAPGIPENRRVKLPGGELVYHVRHGENGLEAIK